MESLLVRYRNLVVLAALLLVQIVGLAVQVRRTDSGRMTSDPGDTGGVRLIRLWANAAVAPPERLLHGIGSGISNLWHDYIDLRGVRHQNQDLKQQVDRLRLEQAALLEDARQGERLQQLLNFQQRYIYSTIAAQVIGTSGTDQSHVVTIDKGEDAGLKHDMAVITAEGIVGKVREVFPRTAQVLVINDQTAGAGVILESTRIRGILRGNAQGQAQIVGIVADSRIQPGEHVLTGGGDAIFPRGLPVGQVRGILRDPDQEGFIRVLVTPAAHLDRLDEVLVITSTEPRFPQDQQQDMATSEAEKGAQVQADEEAAQKKASEIMAEHLPSLQDPSLPPDQQPQPSSPTVPTPMQHPQQPLHPDRFSPGYAPGTSAPPAVTTPGQTAPRKPAPRPAESAPGGTPQ